MLQGAVATTWIAEQRVIFVHPDGTRCEGRIGIGLPVQVSAREARCLVALEGLDRTYAIPGASTLEAMLSAIRFGVQGLQQFRARRGRLLLPDGLTDLPLDTIFGPLFER